MGAGKRRVRPFKQPSADRSVKNMNMVTVYIAVMDYCSGTIKMYSHLFSKHWQTEDIELWLGLNTDYKDAQCYYMASTEPIKVSTEEVA